MDNIKPYKYYSAVEEQEVRWLWYPYIPYGKLTLIQGDPGDGKSTFVINLAASLTKGIRLPDGTELKRSETVVYQCAEDGTADTIKPRLISAGADCSRIAFIDDEEDTLTVNDIRIEQTINALSAKLFVLDPFQAFLPADQDMQSAVRMRATLRRLAQIAEKYKCAVILVGHMNKCTGGKRLYRGLGSIDIAAIARSVLMISRDEENPYIRYMTPVKSSLAPEGEAMSFMIDKDRGFQWIGKCRHDETVNSDNVILHNKRGRTKELLQVMLSAQDVATSEVLEKMLSYGISERTVRNAAKDIGIRAVKRGDKWFWHMDESVENFEEPEDE